MPSPTYDAWYDSPRGGFALDAQQFLLRRMIAGWPRRGHKLLEFGCGSGRFLESFWEAGFDVTGQEQNPDLAALARGRLGPRVDITLHHPEQLPFDDQSFDYAVCLNGLEFAASPAALLREAGRLACRGILLGFPNAWSLRGLLARFGRSQLAESTPNTSASRRSTPAAPEQNTLAAAIQSALAAPDDPDSFAAQGKAGSGQADSAATFCQYGLYRDLSPWRVWKLSRQLEHPGRASWGSILLGPAVTWRPGRLCGAINRLRLPLPLGACVMLRLDLTPARAGTPLLLEAVSRQERPAKAAMARTSYF